MAKTMANVIFYMKKDNLDESQLNRYIVSNTTFRLCFHKEKMLAHTFKGSLEEVIVMLSEKMKAKYMKKDL